MKNSNQKPVLNPYRIFWGVVEITEGKLTANQAKRISTICGGSAFTSKNHFFFHGAAHVFDERFQNVLNNIAVTGVNGKMYKITDKQFGMIANSWNGETPECPKPFKHSIVLKDGKHISVVPLSENQVNEAFEF